MVHWLRLAACHHGSIQPGRPRKDLPGPQLPIPTQGQGDGDLHDPEWYGLVEGYPSDIEGASPRKYPDHLPDGSSDTSETSGKEHHQSPGGPPGVRSQIYHAVGIHHCVGFAVIPGVGWFSRLHCISRQRWTLLSPSKTCLRFRWEAPRTSLSRTQSPFRSTRAQWSQSGLTLAAWPLSRSTASLGFLSVPRPLTPFVGSRYQHFPWSRGLGWLRIRKCGLPATQVEDHLPPVQQLEYDGCSNQRVAGSAGRPKSTHRLPQWLKL